MAVKSPSSPIDQNTAQTQAHAPESKTRPEWAVKVDYISVCSGAFSEPYPDTQETVWNVTKYARSIFSRIGLSALTDPTSGAWAIGAGRQGWSASIRHSSGAALFFGSEMRAPLLEMGGAACDLLRQFGELEPLIYAYWQNITRIDLAGDLECDLTPEAFLAYGHSPRHKTDGHDKTMTGWTEYLGSMTSDRRLKVYRYYDPHPRARFLRVEVTLRRDLAKSAAVDLTFSPVSEVWLAGCSPFALKAPQWRLPSQSLKLQRTMKSEPTAASRLRWLEKQIRPAVIASHKAGLINLTEWLSEAEAG